MIDPRNHEAISPDLAGYALDALDDDVRALVEAHLEGCEDCAAELEELLEGAAALAFAVPLVIPPADLQDRISAIIDGSVEGTTSDQPTPFTTATTDRNRRIPWYASPRLAWGVSSALAAAFIGVIAVAGVVGTRLNDRVDELSAQVSDQEQSVNAVSASITTMERDVAVAQVEFQQVSQLQQSADTLSQQVNDLRWLQYVTSAGSWSMPSFFSGGEQPQAPQGVLIAHASGNKAILMINGLAPAPVGSIYQVWLTYEGHVIPGSTFTVDQNGYAVVNLDLLGDATEYIGASVTVEPVGGSQTPSEFIVLIGSDQ
jgi:anti-sigma factor RsiW